MRRRCAIVTHSYYPADPRPRRHAAALADRGWDVECIALRAPGQKRKETISGVRVLRLPVRHIRRNMRRYMFEYASFFLLAFITLAGRCIGRRYDVVQVHTLPDFLVFSALVPRLFGARIVLDLRQPSPEFFAAHFRRPLRSASCHAVILVERLSARFAHHILVSSEAALAAFRKRGLDGGKMTVVTNACDETFFRPSANGKTNGAGDRPDTIRLIYHGTLIRRYGVETAIRAVSLLRDSREDVRFDIYGEGEQAGALRELVRSLGLEETVKLHGFVPAEQLPAIIGAADIGLIPYERDIFIDMMLPNKLFEYVAMKKPFVVSPIPAVLNHYPPSLLYTFERESPYHLAREVIRIHENGDEAAARAEKLYDLFLEESWGAARRTYLEAIGDRSN